MYLILRKTEYKTLSDIKDLTGEQTTEGLTKPLLYPSLVPSSPRLPRWYNRVCRPFTSVRGKPLLWTEKGVETGVMGSVSAFVLNKGRGGRTDLRSDEYSGVICGEGFRRGEKPPVRSIGGRYDLDGGPGRVSLGERH